MIIHLNQVEAQAVASLATIATHRIVQTPALRVVKLSITSDTITAYATDRHILVRNVIKSESMPDIPESIEPIEVLLPEPLLKQLKTNKGFARLEVSDTEITLITPDSQSVYTRPIGNYPKIEALLDDTEPDGITGQDVPLSLNLDSLAKLTKLVSTDDWQKDSVFEVRSSGLNERGTPQPLILKRANLTVLFQPNRTAKK